MVRLLGPVGCDEANFGTERFVKHEDGHFLVPQEAVDGLTRVGGFVLAPVQPAAAGDGVQSSDEQPAVEAALGDPIE